MWIPKPSPSPWHSNTKELRWEIHCRFILLSITRCWDIAVVFIPSIQVRLDALCQISSFLSEMEEKSVSSLAPPRFPGLLQSVQLQFLSGCFGLGAPITGSLAAPNNKIHHYTVRHTDNDISSNTNHIICQEIVTVVLTWTSWPVLLLKYDVWNVGLCLGWDSVCSYQCSEGVTVCSSHAVPATGACAQTESGARERTGWWVTHLTRAWSICLNAQKVFHKTVHFLNRCLFFGHF